MNLNHKNIEININSDGYFYFKVCGKNKGAWTLEEEKTIIDEDTAAYYNFTEDDINKLLSKLNSREQHFIIDALTELNSHSDSAYCEMGVDTIFVHNIDYKRLGSIMPSL